MKIMPTKVSRSPFTGSWTVYQYIIYLFVSLVKLITAKYIKAALSQSFLPLLVKKK